MQKSLSIFIFWNFLTIFKDILFSCSVQQQFMTIKACWTLDSLEFLSKLPHGQEQKGNWSHNYNRQGSVARYSHRSHRNIRTWVWSPKTWLAHELFLLIKWYYGPRWMLLFDGWGIITSCSLLEEYARRGLNIVYSHLGIVDLAPYFLAWQSIVYLKI